jgi:hypothetical protein
MRESQQVVVRLTRYLEEDVREVLWLELVLKVVKDDLYVVSSLSNFGDQAVR